MQLPRSDAPLSAVRQVNTYTVRRLIRAGLAAQAAECRAAFKAVREGQAAVEDAEDHSAAPPRPHRQPHPREAPRTFLCAARMAEFTSGSAPKPPPRRLPAPGETGLLSEATQTARRCRL
jgi:hypothetical protein